MVSNRKPIKPIMPTPNRDDEHLAKLRDYYAETRRIPTQQRIADLIGFSKAAAKKFLERIEAERFIVRTPDDDAWIPACRCHGAGWHAGGHRSSARRTVLR
jgi:DNA-binding IclR family transcriptional regulator